VSMFAPITRWAADVPTAHAIPEMVRKAFKLAESERPAAVYLAVPEHFSSPREAPTSGFGPPADRPTDTVTRWRGHNPSRGPTRPVALA